MKPSDDEPWGSEEEEEEHAPSPPFPSSTNTTPSTFYPIKLKPRVSAGLIAVTEAGVVACGAPVLSWVAEGRIAPCATLNRVLFGASVALASARLVFMVASAVVQYRAAKAAADEATMNRRLGIGGSGAASVAHTMSSMRESRRRPSRAADDLIAARSRTQTTYDALLVVHALFEPALFIAQLGFLIAHVEKFVEKWPECESNHAYKHAYISLTIASLVLSWTMVVLRVAFGNRVVTYRGLFGHQEPVWEIHFQERIEHILRAIM